jgi:hypothetical protein
MLSMSKRIKATSAPREQEARSRERVGWDGFESWLKTTESSLRSLGHRPILKLVSTLIKFPQERLPELSYTQASKLWNRIFVYGQAMQKKFWAQAAVKNNWYIFPPQRPNERTLPDELSRILDHIHWVLEGIADGKSRGWINGAMGQLMFQKNGKWHSQGLFQPPKSPELVDIGNGSEAFVFNTLHSELVKIGWEQVRRCPQCNSVFFRNGRQKFCSRRCKELDKGRRYTTSPDYNEYHAFLMWVKKCKVRGQSIGSKRVHEWLVGYRTKCKEKAERKKQEPSVSTREDAYYLRLLGSR